MTYVLKDERTGVLIGLCARDGERIYERPRPLVV